MATTESGDADPTMEWVKASYKKKTKAATFNEEKREDEELTKSLKPGLIEMMQDRGLTCVRMKDGDYYVRLQSGKKQIPTSFTEADVEESMKAMVDKTSLTAQAAAVAKTAKNRILAFRRKNGLTARTSAKRSAKSLALVPSGEGEKPTAPAKRRKTAKK